MRVRWSWWALPGLWLVLACSPAGPQGPPNVLLVTIDTLRADRLSSYGYRLPTTPEMDALAARGVRFEDATVQWPLTWPSIGSLLTGAYPKTIGLRLVTRVLPDSLVMMQEVFGDAGYATGAVVSNFNVGKTFAFDQGFDHFVESWADGWNAQAQGRVFENVPGRVKDFTNATIVTDQGLAWLDQAPSDAPFFLWLHYMDPHGPYTPPSGYRTLFEGEHPREPFDVAKAQRYQLQRNGEGPIADLGHYKAQYDREVRYLDSEIGRLLAEVEARSGDRPLLVALTADHGESLGEHDYYLSHGKLAYDASARVPAILVLDGELPAGRVVEEPIGLVDFGRTLVHVAGIEPPESFEGTDLRPLIAGEAGSAPEHVFMEAGFDPVRPQRVVRSGRWKLISVGSPDDRRQMTGAFFEPYDVREDPGEVRNVAAENPEVVARLRRALDRWLETGLIIEPGQPVDPKTLGPRERQMLRDLGYLE